MTDEVVLIQNPENRWVVTVSNRDDLSEPLFSFGPLQGGPATDSAINEILQRLNPDEYIVTASPIWDPSQLAAACDEIAEYAS